MYRFILLLLLHNFSGPAWHKTGLFGAWCGVETCTANLIHDKYDALQRTFRVNALQRAATHCNTMQQKLDLVTVHCLCVCSQIKCVLSPRSRCLRPGESTNFLIGHFPGGGYYPGWLHFFFSVSQFLLQVLSRTFTPSPLLGVCVISYSPWSMVLSFSFRVYHSILISSTVCTVLMGQ